MLLVSFSTFDGDGNLTQSRSYFGPGGSDYYATLYAFDTDETAYADAVTK